LFRKRRKKKNEGIQTFCSLVDDQYQFSHSLQACVGWTHPSLNETTKKYEDQIINTAAIVSYILIAIILKDRASQTFVERVNASMDEVDACVCEIDLRMQRFHP